MRSLEGAWVSVPAVCGGVVEALRLVMYDVDWRIGVRVRDRGVKLVRSGIVARRRRLGVIV